jgi:quercetin dioxygenase-like cupin family protein
MEKLQSLTEQIVNLSKISEDSSTGLREYKLENGMAFSATVYQSSGVAAAVFTASKGTVFPYHMHPKSKEILVLYKGRITVISDFKRVEMTTGSVVEMASDEGHMLNVHEDSKMLVITIPPDFEAIAKIKSNGR